MSKLKLKNVPLSTEEENENLLDNGSGLLDDSGIFDDSGDIFITGGSTTIGLEGKKIDVNIHVTWDSGNVHIPDPRETDEHGNPITIHNEIPISIDAVSYSLDSSYQLVPHPSQPTAYPIACSGVWVGANTISVSANPYYGKIGGQTVMSELLTGAIIAQYIDLTT